MRNTRLSGFLIAMTILLLAVPVSHGKSSDAAQSEAPALTVSIVLPETERWPQTLPASGWLAAWHEATISSQTSGLRIVDVLADVGSVVKKGQPLVMLSQDNALADLHKQEAVVEQAKANVEKAKSDVQRVERIGQSGAFSEQQKLEYANTQQTAAATLDSEEASLTSQQIALQETVIRAADDGIISSRSASLGAVVSAGTELFKLIRQQRVEWQAEIVGRDLGSVTEGLSASIDLPDGHHSVGHVRLVSPTVSTDTGRAMVFVQLNSDEHPRAGLYVSGHIELQTTEAVVLPESAIVFRDGMNYVFIVGDDGRVTRERVETGRRRDSLVEIVSPLALTSRVVKSGGAFLSDKAVVKVQGAVK